MTAAHLRARLELPRLGVAWSARAAARESHDEPGVAALADDAVPRWVERLLADRFEETPRAPGGVPATTLWWTAGDEFLGRVHLRHRLTPALWEVGGHVGYRVVPAHRRRGHATAMLAETLPVAAALGLDEVLVTCDHDNVASRRVIEANGGVFDDRRGEKLRYWVATGRAAAAAPAGRGRG